MLVPYVKTLGNPTEKYLEDLDTEMSRILNNKILKTDDKIKMYSSALNRFKVNYDPDILGNAPNRKMSDPIQHSTIKESPNEIKVEKLEKLVQNLSEKFENSINHLDKLKSSPSKSDELSMNTSISDNSQSLNNQISLNESIIEKDTSQRYLTSDSDSPNKSTAKFPVKIATRSTKPNLKTGLNQQYRTDNKDNLSNVSDLNKAIIKPPSSILKRATFNMPVKPYTAKAQETWRKSNTSRFF